jgi:hypothetical protein
MIRGLGFRLEDVLKQENRSFRHQAGSLRQTEKGISHGSADQRSADRADRC